MPILQECLQILHETENCESVLIMSRSAVLTLEHETALCKKDMERLADQVYEPEEIGAGPASGSYRADGMLIVPCKHEDSGGHMQRLCGQSDPAGCRRYPEGGTSPCPGGAGRRR